MGCFQATLKPVVERSPLKSRKHSATNTYSWEQKRVAIDPKDYIAENLKGETVGRVPGSVNGQQFVIQNCEDSSIYILDHLNTVTVDDCVNCNIILGPTRGSVFLRNCRDCRVAAICQQLRTRDCHRVDCFLCCATQPSIESSNEMRFGCVCINYRHLEDHFKSAGLSPFNNNWRKIHDFTPNNAEPNWTLLPQDARMEDFLPVPVTLELSQVQLSMDPATSVVPRVPQADDHEPTERCLVVFFSDGQSLQRATCFVREMEKTTNALVRTLEVSLTADNAERIFGTDSYDRVVGSGPVIAVEYAGRDCVQSCQEVAKAIATETGSTGLVYVSGRLRAATRQLQTLFSVAEPNLHLNRGGAS